MKIKSLLPYFGAKRKMASKIVEVMGKHKVYWEPFCGSCAVLFGKPKASMETVNDLHADLINLARVVKCDQMAVEFYSRLARVIPSQELFRDALLTIKGSPCAVDNPFMEQTVGYRLDRAVEYFIVSWLGMNGVAGTATVNSNFAKRYTSNGGPPGCRFRGAVDSIPDWHKRLREVVVLSECGIAICEKIEDKDGTTIFIDPPYFAKGAKYLHDFSKEDHERLAAALGRFKKTRVVVSYYDDPRLEELYRGWTKIDCSTNKAMPSSGMRDGTHTTVAPEVLLVNRA